MFRRLYRCVLCLHPPAFRRRFSEGMLSIFDHTAVRSSGFRLVLDGFLSLARQWTLRPEFWHDISSEQLPVPDGIPSFTIIGPYRPRAGAVIHGLVLSIAVFCVTCFAIKYSWIHVLQVRIPEVQFESPQPIQPHAALSASENVLTPNARPDETGTPAAPPSGPHSVNDPTRPLPLAAGRNPGVQPRAEARSKLRDGAEASPKHGSQVANGTALGITSDGTKLDAAEQQRVTAAVIKNLNEHYADRQVAQKIADALRASESRRIRQVTDGAAFADHLTGQLRDVSHDMHLEVVYSEVRLPDRALDPAAEVLARYRKELQKDNCTFEKVEILPHNIGYLKLNSFPDLSICGSTAMAAMASLNRADAIIFDLRDNGGGYPNMVSLIAAYLFDHPEYIYDPRVSPTQHSWTRSPVPGNRLADKPVYVLTSASTVSAAEQFCYNLKMLKRATLVGETTRGSAHAGVWYRIDDHFGMGVPETKPMNPYSKTDWEGTGVEPDIKVSAADALETAQKRAESQLRKH
jgi:hypothetical protein